jgi:Outer membrane protein beta-barrel domain
MIHIPMLLALAPGLAPSQPLEPTTQPAPPAQPEQPITSMQPPPLIAAPSAPVLADSDGYDFSYTFVELGYHSTDLDTLGEKSSAYRGRASLGLLRFFYVFLDYTQEDVDFLGSTVDSSSYGLGIGGHFGLTSKLDLVGEVSWLYDDLSSDTISDLDDSNSGYTALVGARWMALPLPTGGLELNGGFRWIDQQSLLSKDELGAWEAGARFHFLKFLSVGASYQYLDKDSRWGLNGRFSF